MSEENQEYIDFVEKFKPKPKLTTDDCYTPPAIYEAIKDYAVERYNLHGARILRPFFRGGGLRKGTVHG